MKKLAKTAMTALAAALVSQGAQAAYNDDDLILGFNGNSGSSDYIINLGNANSVVGVGGTSLVDLSADFNRSTFNSVWASFVGTRVGVVGGQNSITLGVNAY